MSHGEAIRNVESTPTDDTNKEKMENKRHHNSLLTIFLFKRLKTLNKCKE